MAKRFAYISFGVLCLTAAYQIGAERGEADGMYFGDGNLVAGDGHRWFTGSGEAWMLMNTLPPRWERNPTYDLPVAGTDTKFLGSYGGPMFLVTFEEEGWVHNGMQWRSAGPFPGGPVSIEQESAGRVKGRYR